MSTVTAVATVAGYISLGLLALFLFCCMVNGVAHFFTGRW